MSTPAIPEALARYLLERDAQHAEAVTTFLASLTDRERALIRDVAVMGYVQGRMHPQRQNHPKDSLVLALVVDACLAHRDLYPAVDAISEATAPAADSPGTPAPSYAELRAAYDESRQLIELQKGFLIDLRSTVLTAMDHRERQGRWTTPCDGCGRDHIGELGKAIHTADKAYATAFPPTADGPARPGLLPEQQATADDYPSNQAPANRCAHRGPHPGFSCAEVDNSQPYFRVRWDQQQDETARKDAVSQEQAADDAQRTSRRASLGTLLSCAERMALSTTDASLLRQHVEAEIREADTARAEAKRQESMGLSAIRAAKKLLERRTNTLRKRAEDAGHERDVALADLEKAQEAACRALQQRQEMAAERHAIQTQRDTADRIRAEVQRDRDQHAAVLRDILSRFTSHHGVGHQCLTTVPGHVFKRWQRVVEPTVGRPWWETVATAEQEAVDATQHVLELKATIERVRAATTYMRSVTPTWGPAADLVDAALDGAEQPTRSSRLCHATDPTTLRERARKHQHDGPHQDADLEWPVEQPTTGGQS